MYVKYRAGSEYGIPTYGPMGILMLDGIIGLETQFRWESSKLIESGFPRDSASVGCVVLIAYLYKVRLKLIHDMC